MNLYEFFRFDKNIMESFLKARESKKGLKTIIKSKRFIPRESPQEPFSYTAYFTSSLSTVEEIASLHSKPYSEFRYRNLSITTSTGRRISNLLGTSPACKNS